MKSLLQALANKGRIDRAMSARDTSQSLKFTCHISIFHLVTILLESNYIVRVRDFLPSQHEFSLINNWPSYPLIKIQVGDTTIAIGNASNGLCDGMIFAVTDHYFYEIAIKQLNRPWQGASMYNFIMKRLIQSIIAVGPLKYYFLMLPSLQDHNTWFTQGRAWFMIKDEWPLIESDLDIGYLVPLGIITVKSKDPSMLRLNHQTLAYAYELVGNILTFHVYDLNLSSITRPEKNLFISMLI